MSFLLFFRGMIATLIVFAIATFALTQSIWTTFISTAICAVVIQVGYFVAILFMVWREGPKEQQVAERTDLEARPYASGTVESTKATGPTQTLRNVSRPRR